MEFKIFNRPMQMLGRTEVNKENQPASNIAETGDSMRPGAGASKRDTNAHVLHIEKLSSDVTDAGIKNVCSKYGNVQLVKKIHPTACLVTFSSTHDVDLAIHQINANENQLGWHASRKRSANSRSSAGGTTSDSESSVIVTTEPVTKTPVVRPAIDEDQHNHNWTARKFAGPFSQPAAVTVPKGVRVPLPRVAAAFSQTYADDPDVMRSMKNMALSSEGDRSKAGVFDEVANPVEALCVRCKTVSVATCENCGDHYCSSKCQRADWPEHRFICFPIPRLVPHSKTNPSLGPPIDSDKPVSVVPTAPVLASPSVTRTYNSIARHPAPRNHSPIIITYAVDHRRVFVRSAEPLAIEDYKQTVMAVNEAADSAPLLVKPPVRGSFVLAHYENIFYRALVLSVDDDGQIDVAYIDFGNKERKQLTDLRHMPADLMLLARHPIEVQLADVPERMHTDTVAQRLHSLIDTATVLQLHCDNDQIGGGCLDNDGRLCKNAVVRLIDERTNECVNETLCTLNHVKVVAQATPPLMLDDLQYVPVNGVGIDMLVLDNSLLTHNILSCIRSADAGTLVKNTKRFQEYCGATTGPYTPRPEELCLAMYKGQWYRAACMEVVGDRMPTLQFIDHGFMQCINIADIRKMPKAFAYELITHDYAIDGIDEVSDAMLPVMTDYFAVNNVVTVDKAETIQVDGRAVYVLHCERLLNTLRQQKHLIASK